MSETDPDTLEHNDYEKDPDDADESESPEVVPVDEDDA